MISTFIKRFTKLRFDEYESNLYCDLFSADRLQPSSVCSSKGNLRRQLVSHILDYVLRESPSLLAKTRSQTLQELFVFTLMRGNIMTYFEAGANDGLTLSNTAGLMSSLKASGILVEANPYLYNSLRLNRPFDTCLNYALSNQTGSILAFNPGEGSTLYGALIEGNEMAANVSPVKQVLVPSRTIPDIFDEASLDHVDFLSLDIEGAEPEVLKPILAPSFHCGIIEANTESAFSACKLKLIKLGYQCYRYPFARNELLVIGPNAIVDLTLLKILDNQFSLLILCVLSLLV